MTEYTESQKIGRHLGLPNWHTMSDLEVLKSVYLKYSEAQGEIIRLQNQLAAIQQTVRSFRNDSV